MLEAQEKIRTLEAQIAELAAGDTVEGVSLRLAEVEGKTEDLDVADFTRRMTEVEGLTNTLEGQAILKDFFFVNPTEISVLANTWICPYTFGADAGETIHIAA